MRPMALGMAVALISLVAAAGCADIEVTRAVQRAELPSYRDAESTIPAQADDSMRLYVYRPQSFVGAGGSAVIIVNGRWLGNKDDPVTDNLLIPGTVFVVDVPVAPARLWSYQRGRGEDQDTALELSPTQSRTWFLRWTLKPTYGYLSPVDEHEALADLALLRFSGYVELDGPPSAPTR